MFFIPAKRALRPLMLLSAMRLILKWFLIPAKRALRPRMLLRALRPGVILASLASADVPRRLASNQLASLHRAFMYNLDEGQLLVW